MRLPFLDRQNERNRLHAAFSSREGTFCCIYGRRRCGKSRLLRESLPSRRSVYYVGDRREAGLQRTAMAEAMAGMIPGFGDVTYPQWETLLRRWWHDAPTGAVLAIDEFPYLVEASPELPSLLQKMLDAQVSRGVHLVVCGSSQRMMQGLVLDASEPLFGRAREIMRVDPLGAAWLPKALGTRDWRDVVDAYAVWGGVPRYWELARERATLWEAVEALVLDPAGVLNREPERLLSDDMRDTAQASSVLALVGQGCHRLSEIAGRLGKPATSLTRPMQRLLQLGLLKREVPFGAHGQTSRATLYSVNDPFLAFWFRFVDPNRSRLGAGSMPAVSAAIRSGFPLHAAAIWEQLVRAAVPRSILRGRAWSPAARWWGAGKDRQPLEFDVLSESEDKRSLLVGEVKLRAGAREIPRIEAELRSKADRLPLADRYAEVIPLVFVVSCEGRSPRSGSVVTAAELVPGLT